MNKGFTLIELLVVVAIMGLLGTASVAGYRQMQRGMEERGVVDAATKFVQLVAERAQIDRKTTAVLFWNELIREETDDQNAIVVGKAVAVRTKGRISQVRGSYLIDEFGDFEQYDDENGGYDQNPVPSKTKMRLYLMDNLVNDRKLRYASVRDIPEYVSSVSRNPELYLSSNPLQDGVDNGRIHRFGYAIDGNGTAGSGQWKVGSLYGLEFRTLELPHGYIFGSQVPTSMSSPATEGVTLVFDPEAGSSAGSAVGSSTVDIYSLRPGQGGAVSAQKVGPTKAPKTSLN